MSFDFVSRYNEKQMSERKWLIRAVFLETVAAVPGLVSATHRQLRSLRKMKKDLGWIHHLFEESENERVHLFIFLTQTNPGPIMRFFVALAQAYFYNFYFFVYMWFPKFAHRFVGFLEEEACHTYTVLLR